MKKRRIAKEKRRIAKVFELDAMDFIQREIYKGEEAEKIWRENFEGRGCLIKPSFIEGLIEEEFKWKIQEKEGIHIRVKEEVENLEWYEGYDPKNRKIGHACFVDGKIKLLVVASEVEYKQGLKLKENLK